MEAILLQGLCCWYSAGLAALALFFPDHQVHRISVPGPFSYEIEDTSAEATSKGQSCQLLLPVF